MLKKTTLFLIFTTNIAYQWGMLPSCKIVKIPEGTDVIELKSKPNELSLVQISISPGADKQPTDGYRLVNMKDPSKKLFLGHRCFFGYSQLFQNATNEPARIACYKCRGLASCTNNCFDQGKLEAETKDEQNNTNINCFTDCKLIDCSKIVELTKCEKSDRSKYTENNTDRILGLIETPQAAPKK